MCEFWAQNWLVRLNVNLASFWYILWDIMLSWGCVLRKCWNIRIKQVLRSWEEKCSHEALHVKSSLIELKNHRLNQKILANVNGSKCAQLSNQLWIPWRLKCLKGLLGIFGRGIDWKRKRKEKKKVERCCLRQGGKYHGAVEGGLFSLEEQNHPLESSPLVFVFYFLSSLE